MITNKKNTIVFIFLGICSIVSGTTYYVSSAGNDGANGTSTNTPWATLNKVNGFSFAAGDNILFNRGDTFYGTLKITSSGTSVNHITFGAYGTGANPIITGFTTISGWTNYGGGIYSKAVSAASVPFNMVTVNGVNTGKGQYPKPGNWLTNSSVGTGTITATNMPSSTINWAQNGTANIFMKTEGYRWNHGLITSHSGNVINYTQQSGWCGGNGYAGWGYFIDNDLRTLSTVNGVAPKLGEWFHNGTTFYMYFGSVDPATKTVQVATLDNALVCSQSYITIDNINFIGFNGDQTYYNRAAVQLEGSSNISVTNCEIGFTGAGATYPGNYTTCDNCSIHDTNGNAIVGQTYNYLTLTNSIIENVGLIYDMSGGWYARGMAMNLSTGTNALIQYNIFRHIASFGAYIQGAPYATVDKNLFDDCVSRAFDSGCIYVNGNGSTGRVISNNICINTQGSIEGITTGSWPFWTTAEAIYCDYPNTGITITGNTCANTVHGSGIKLHHSHDMTVSNNTLYNNYMGYQILDDEADNPIRNLNLSNNKIIAANAVRMLIAFLSIHDDINLFGTATGQIYGRPVDDGVNQDFYTDEATAGHAYITYAYWLSRSGETNSTFSSVTASSINNIRFIYNASKSNMVVSLDGGYLDVMGTKYSGSITLLPYTSAVLMPDPNPSASSASPAYVSSAVEDATPTLIEIDYSSILANVLSNVNAFSVRVNSVSQNVESVAVSGTSVILTLANEVTYGDVVTVAYTKPATNALVSASGIQVATMSDQTVTNKINPVGPIYISSSIENSTPKILEINYDEILYSSVPDTSAFIVIDRKSVV